MTSTDTASAIRGVLGQKRVSGRELGRRLGMSPTSISRRLSGEMEFSISELLRVAAALDVDPATLIPPVEAAS